MPPHHHLHPSISFSLSQSGEDRLRSEVKENFDSGGGGGRGKLKQEERIENVFILIKQT
jgi:hypothetical protein